MCFNCQKGTRKGKEAMLRRAHCYCGLLFAIHCFSCATPPPSLYQTISVPTDAENLTGEKHDVFQKYGVPDYALEGPYGVIQWGYCKSPDGAFVVEFDSPGNVMALVAEPVSSLCPQLP